MQKTINHVYSLRRPTDRASAIALVIDLPHSGTCLPFSHRIGVPREVAASTWDGFADQLWAGAYAVDATLLAARFPRSYIDIDQAPDEISETLLAQARGATVVNSLSPAEIRMRIEQYHQPYHRMLEALLDDAHQRFGAVWHIGCRSVAATGDINPAGAAKACPDIVIRDGNGASADSAFTEWAAEELEQLGYQVQINGPQSGGGHIVQRHGRAQQGRNSIQIAIRRGLYMHDSVREKNAGFERLKADLDSFLASAASYIEEQLAREIA
jgi:N-formylglutamate deformylase